MHPVHCVDYSCPPSYPAGVSQGSSGLVLMPYSHDHSEVPWLSSESWYSSDSPDAPMLLAWASAGVASQQFLPAAGDSVCAKLDGACPEPRRKKSRTRPTVDVCEACRRSKVRCDEVRPCSRCVKQNLQSSCVSWRKGNGSKFRKARSSLHESMHATDVSFFYDESVFPSSPSSSSASSSSSGESMIHLSSYCNDTAMKRSGLGSGLVNGKASAALLGAGAFSIAPGDLPTQ